LKAASSCLRSVPPTAGPALTRAAESAGSAPPVCSTYRTGPWKTATVTLTPSAVRTWCTVTCGTGFGFGLGLGLGLGFGVGVALACRAGVADGALDVPGLLLAAGAAAGGAVDRVGRQTTAPTTNINRMRDSIGTRCDGTVKGLAAAMPGARRSARHPVRLRPACPPRRPRAF